MLGSRSWRALMRRNIIYRKRNWLATILEMILPIFFVYTLLLIKNSTEDDDQTAKLRLAFIPSDSEAYVPLSFHDYVTAMQVTRICEEQLVEEGWNGTVKTSLGISGIDRNGFNWMVPTVKCDHRLCEEPGQDAAEFCEYKILAVTGSDEAGVERARDFAEWIYETYPALNSSDIKFTHDFVQVMDSESALADYVTGGDYGKSGFPKVAMAVVFEGNDPHNFIYTLRQNSTNFNNPAGDGRPTAKSTPPTDQKFDSFAKNDFECPYEDEGPPEQGPLQESCTGLYFYNGVLTFQRLVGDYILHETGADSLYPVSRNGARFVQFPTPEYEDEGFFADLAGYGPLLMTLGLLYPVAAMVGYITREKELRQKELMKMMSVTESDIGWSWFCSFLLVHFLSSTATAGVSSVLFENSDFGYLWFFWIMSFVAIINFSMALAALTSKATRGVLIGLLVFFAGVILTSVLDYQDASSGLISLVSLHPLAAFSFGLQEIAYLEDRGVGLRSTTVDSSDYPSGYTFSNAVSSLILSIILWGVVAWYLNRVIRPDYGQAMPLHFPFTKSYWCPGSARSAHTAEDAEEDDDTHNDVPFEPVPETLRRQAKEGKSIEIRNLRKAFGDNLAVDGLNLSMYSGSITALLGHNGAGKTTTISMLTGTLTPTEGYALVAGKDIRSQTSQIRQDLGICLQHDCLFPNLTVHEHIKFFARIKGIYSKMSNEEVEAHIDQAIADVALSEKSNTLAKNLSGGMKRKLSVAIAFCGDSKVVLLDEPTSGMDPFSRRFTWNVIRNYRKGRCIILTTHFMDEADILGDRIAIMAKGQLQCCGSSLFLKKTYGVGYQLVIEKKSGHGGDEENEDGKHGSDKNLKQIVTSNVEDATLLSNVGTELSFQLPMASSSQFTPMFEGLEEQIEKGTVVSYGVSITTLEEVFLLVAKGHEAKKKEYMSVSLRVPGQSSQALLENDGIKSSRSRMDLEKEGLLGRHIGALVKKRAAFFRRDKKAWCCTTILPGLFVLFGFLIFKLASSTGNMDELRLDFDKFNRKAGGIQPVVYNTPDEPFTCQPGACVYQQPFFNNEETGEIYAYCGYEGNLHAFDFEDVPLEKPSCTINDSGEFAVQLEELEGFVASGVTVSNVSEASTGIVESKQKFSASQYGAVFFTHEVSSSISDSNTTYAEAVVQECTDSPFASQEACNKLAGLGFLIQYNFTALHSSPLFQALVDETLVNQYRAVTGVDEEFVVDARIHPLPITKLEKGYSEAQDATTAWLLVVLSFPFIAGSFASFVVAERESKAKHLQTVAGVEPSAYWISTLLWDTANYMIPCWLVVALMYAFDVSVLTTTTRNVVSGVIATLLFFGPAAAGFSYVLSFGFTSPAVCNVFVIVSGFLIGLGGPLTCFIMLIIARDTGNPKPKLEDIANVIAWVLRIIFPTFNLGNALLNAINIEFIDFLYGESKSAWSDKVLLLEVIFLIIQGVLYTALAIQMDILSTKPSFMAAWKKFLDVIGFRICFGGRSKMLDITVALPEDDDVIAEQDRVAAGGANSDLIVLSQLTKIYDTGKVAVNNVSLGIPPGECFGLLGINGAGKTTTMGIMTAEFPPTSGDATLAGFSVTREPQKIRRRIGYCPQFDAHFSNLTGREHCELYASIKGVPLDFVKEAAAIKLREVGLEEKDWDRLSSGYSGGMKRRLSLACATIGEPQIVFLDECSTGVDPVARREIWQLISDMVTRGANEEERTSVVLTTHSMEECEALCPRIGIMANGRLRCLGSAQHLKNKFGQGFQVELKAKLVSKDDPDYVDNASKLLRTKQGVSDEEAVDVDAETFFNLSETQNALQALTGDESLSSVVNAENPTGYTIWKDAMANLLTLDELAAFATGELRMANLGTFIETNYPNSILRERQDNKARYEVSSQNVRISSIFASIESNKEKLMLADYGVSQTSLEQVFIHIAQSNL